MHLLALIVPTASALVFFSFCLGGATFLSDDYLLVSLLDPETGAVQWAEILSSFTEGWFLSPAYWRPLVNLSYGINIALLGFSPLSLHVVNLLLHLVVVAATAEICHRLGSREHPLLAAVFGGVFVALHPLSPEPVLWISARTTGLEVCFRMLAVVAFAAYLRNRRRSTYGLVFLFSALALASKESAVLVPVYLLFVDILDSPRRPARERLSLHAPLFVLWLAYAVLRLAIFGRVLGTGVPQAGAGDIPWVLGQKLSLLMAPDVLSAIGWLGLVLVTVTLAWGRFQMVRTMLPVLGLGALCLVLSLAPTYNVPLGEGTVGARMLYGSLPVLAIVICRCLLTGPDRRIQETNRRAGALSALILFGTFGFFCHAMRYQESWQVMGSARTRIATLGEGAAAGRPLALVSVPRCGMVPGPVNPMSYLAFGRRPFVSKPFALAGLGFPISPPPISAELINDPRPVHAFLAAGCPVAAWVGVEEGHGEMRLLSAYTRNPGRFARETAVTGVVTFESARSISSIEHIRVRASDTTTGGQIPQLHIHFSGGVLRRDEKVFDIDVSRNGALLRDILEGRTLEALKVEVEGGRLLDVQVSDRLPRLELNRRMDGFAMSVSKLETGWVAPSSEHPAPMRVVLLGEATGLTWSVEPGKPVSIPRATLEVMQVLARRVHTRRYHYYFETTAPQGSPGSARSDLDWFVLDEESD